MHSWMDPSVVGRWERTPVVLPILDQLDVVDEPTTEPPGLSQVQPEDLIPSVEEYVIGAGDLVTVTVFELLVQGVESVQTRRVDELGMIRLPVIGPVKAEGKTPSELEAEIARILAEKNVLQDATVSVIVQEQRQNTFSVIGESTYASTAIGTYAILGKEFRLLDAMALARGVPGQIKKLYVIRQEKLTRPRREAGPAPVGEAGGPAPLAVPQTPAELLEGLLKGQEPKPAEPEKGVPEEKPESGIFGPPPEAPGGRWVKVGEQWVYSEAPVPPAPAEGVRLPRQRVIEIPYDRLLDGDTSYNIIIRPGDVIRVPPAVIGNVYVGGAVNRPGTYNLPGDRDLTLKQLIIAAGNLSPIAIPERVDLIRRIGYNREVTVRVNLRAIFAGTQPDIFLKPNDTVNVGTSFVATPLAIIRNGFRMTYGFGFVLDRNFDTDVFGP